jgi:DNA-binding LacI/PurR family transcriptional regulator
LVKSGTGSKTGRATLAQIAKAAGVSPSTASFVLGNKPNPITISEATTLKVKEAAMKHGYRANAAARALATGRADAVLVTVVRSATWNSRAFSERLHGIMDYLTPLGYSVHICTIESEAEAKDYGDILLSGRVDGVLLSGNGGNGLNAALSEMRTVADQAGIPMIAIADEYPAGIAESVVDTGDLAGGEMATDHLISHGHKRVALLTVLGQPWAESREQGYRQALEKAGITIDPSLIVRLPEHDQKMAYEAAKDLAKSPDFSAMFVVTDMLAAAAMSAIKSVGRKIPEDCALVGYDDIDAWDEYVEPPLTSIRHAVREAGQRAAESLVNVIEGRPVQHVQLPVSIVIRASCGCKSTP